MTEPTVLADEHRPGDRIGDRYVVRRLLGEPGGQGATYLAHDAEGPLGDVAVKLLHAYQYARSRRQFDREIELLREFAKTPHDNVVRLLGTVDHDARDGRTIGLVLELAEESLADALYRGPLTESEARVLAADLASALEALHSRGWSHNDVKPTNVLRFGPHYKLSDFGVATHIPDRRGRVRLPRRDDPYAPPERGHDNLVATLPGDVYSFAAVMFHALSGQAPPRDPDALALRAIPYRFWHRPLAVAMRHGESAREPLDVVKGFLPPVVDDAPQTDSVMPPASFANLLARTEAPPVHVPQAVDGLGRVPPAELPPLAPTGRVGSGAAHAASSPRVDASPTSRSSLGRRGSLRLGAVTVGVMALAVMAPPLVGQYRADAGRCGYLDAVGGCPAISPPRALTTSPGPTESAPSQRGTATGQDTSRPAATPMTVAELRDRLARRLPVDRARLPAGSTVQIGASHLVRSEHLPVGVRVTHHCFCLLPEGGLAQLKVKVAITNRWLTPPLAIGGSAKYRIVALVTQKPDAWTSPWASESGHPRGVASPTIGSPRLWGIPPNPNRKFEDVDGYRTFATHWDPNPATLGPGQAWGSAANRRGDLVYYVPYSLVSGPTDEWRLDYHVIGIGVLDALGSLRGYSMDLGVPTGANDF